VAALVRLLEALVQSLAGKRKRVGELPSLLSARLLVCSESSPAMAMCRDQGPN
jgi:hypothetical protein